ncbi:LCP family protein [Halothermothrix orenii]|uniref:Cell envelope-related transcriptional attenuator n=1 Tax=Halothermothrix orenii (strain H 168 / OCM 544 / DSM 9562) TaxID=373903 RepID=B8CXS0_HALOH|nr:LCP family protein [Halothermothrix orenii]ACL70089.1 cell envelope-related transcriptional attenuator [Halothermothrix orenii H 168]
MRKPSKSIIATLFIILFITGFILAIIFNTQFSVLRRNPFNTSKLNILVVGYDSSINGPPRADTIILASVDLDTKEVGILSIPRDTRVEIPGHGVNRVNASHAFGGVKLTHETLESFLNVRIDYYVETDFQGFARIVDAIGGVKVYIEEPLHYVDKAGGLYIDLPAGEHLLNGEKALEYVRFREPVYGDIGRIKRQQKFIKSMIKKVLSPDTIVKLPAIYKIFRESVKTNIPLKDISPFIHLFKDVNLDNIQAEIVPGEPRYIDGVSYWISDRKKLGILVENLIMSKEYINNGQYHLVINNGNGVTGLAGELSDELEKYGFYIEKIGNADHFDYNNTLIKYYDIRDKNCAFKIQKLIGGKVKHVEDTEKGFLEIIIGHDYLKRIDYKEEKKKIEKKEDKGVGKKDE